VPPRNTSFEIKKRSTVIHIIVVVFLSRDLKEVEHYYSGVDYVKFSLGIQELGTVEEVQAQFSSSFVSRAPKP
jgi:hypothetical protein